MFNNFLNKLKDILFKPIFYKGGFSSFLSSSNRKDSQLFFGILLRSVDTISSNIANTEFHLVEHKDKINRNVDQHPAYKLLKRPNDFFTGNDLLYLTAAHIITSGIAYWYIVPNGNGEPVEIWILPPQQTIIKKGNNFIDGYIFINNAGNRIEFTTDEIIPIFRPNPYDMWKGISLVDAARYEVNADLNAILWNSNFFKHGAVPSGALEIDAPLDKEKVEIVRDSIREFYEGTENAHRIMVLGKGQKYNQLGPKQKEMDFIEQRKFSRDNILSIFNTPKSIVGITEDVNRANAEVADYVFAKRNIKPLLNLIFEKLNVFYLPKFKETEGLEFDYKDPIPEDKLVELEEDKAAVNNWMTINEVRAKRGLEPLGEEANVLYAPMNLIPLTNDLDTSNPQKTFLKGLNKRERIYLLKKRKLFENYSKQMNYKLKQHFKFLIKEIKNKKIEKIYKTKGSEQVISYLRPILNNWSVLTAKILFNFGQQISQETVNLNKDVYNIPKIDMSHIIPLLRDRSDTVSGEMVDTLINRAKEIIAKNLEDNVFDPDKIIEDVADTLDEESSYRAERIMRTELAYAFNASALEDYKSAGFVEKIKWLVGDNPCPICEENNGEIIKLGEVFPTGHTEPPLHPNCECDIVPIFE